MLAQLPTLKARLGVPAYEIGDDALLAALLRFVTARFELECHRRFARLEVAVFDFRGDATDLRVDRYPVESLAGFFLRRPGDGQWQALPDVTAQLSASASVIELSAPLGAACDRGRVVFAGGYVLPGNTPAPGQAPLPPELEQATLEQTAYLYENRNRLGLVSIGGGSGAIDILRDLNLLPQSASQTTGSVWFKYAQVDLLPSVRAILRPYTRLLW